MSQSQHSAADVSPSNKSLDKEAAAVAQIDLEADIPDGGLQAWLSVLGGCVFVFPIIYTVMEE